MITLPVFKGRTLKTRRLVAHAIIDDADWFLTQYVWRLHSDGYAFFYSKTHKAQYLHRMILWHEGREEVSHLNGNPLDNRSANLVVASNSENKLNPNDKVRGESSYRGIARDNNVSLKKPWRGKVRVNGTQHCTTRYATELEAAIALNALRESLGVPIDPRVNGPLPLEHGNFLSRNRKRVLAEVKPL